MNDQEIARILVDILADVAPGADLAGLDARRSLREQLELDSMDVLGLVTQIEARLGVSVPEADYGAIDSLAGCVAYVSSRRAGARDRPVAT